MKRRRAIKTLSLGAGYTMTGAGFAAFISSCKQEGTITEVAGAWTPSFMSVKEATALEKVLDAFLPTTESSPGAKELNIIQVIDNVVNKLFKEKEQNDFKIGVSGLVSRLSKQEDNESGVNAFMETYMSGKDTKELKELQTLMGKKEEALEENEKSSYYFGHFLSTIRSQGISAYFSNETIATEHLSYDPIPGAFIGCHPLSEVGNSWSL